MTRAFARSIVTWLVCAHGGIAAAQDKAMFKLAGSGDDTTVGANLTGVSADEALRELARSLGWGIDFETEALRQQMSNFGLDLAFDAQGPRTIAHLLAVAGGADIVISDRSVLGERQVQLMIVTPPSADTESGRQRLREWAIRWYRTFLRDDLRYEPLVEKNGMDARMHMARLLVQQGALEEAALVYHEVQVDSPSHAYVPTALLELARCRFELGEEHWKEAEDAARELTRRHPSLPQSAAGTVLLGEILLASKRYQECIKTLTASYLRLAGTPEIIEMYLLVARAEYALGNADGVLRTMNILDGAHEYRDLDESQWLDYLFLRGYALHELGRHEETLEPLEIFLGMAPQDPRRGIAFVMLGRTYLALERFVEARAAAIEANHLKIGGKLDPEWAREVSKFYAKTALEIGDRDEAFDKLEIEVRTNPESEPELVLYLVDAFLHAERYQKAIITAELIVDMPGAFGEKARVMRIEAMWRQSLDAGGVTMRTFPERAMPLIDGITETASLQRIAEIFGKAYESVGEVEKAADAYRGMLR